MSLIVLDQKTPTKKFLPQKLFQSPYDDGIRPTMALPDGWNFNNSCWGWSENRNGNAWDTSFPFCDPRCGYPKEKSPDNVSRSK